METIIKNVERMTIQSFAEKYGLKMTIVERERPSEACMRYYANFDRAEIRRGDQMLCAMHGNGPSPALAVAAYAKALSGELLILNAMTDKRREIRVPRLTMAPNWRATCAKCR